MILRPEKPSSMIIRIVYIVEQRKFINDDYVCPLQEDSAECLLKFFEYTYFDPGESCRSSRNAFKSKDGKLKINEGKNKIFFG